MSSGNKDYFTEMVKSIVGLGIVALIIVFGLRLVVGAFSSDGADVDEKAINERLKAIETVSLVGEPLPSVKPAPAAPAKKEEVPAAKPAPATPAETAPAPAGSAPAPAEAAPAVEKADTASAEDLYKTKCATCHAVGVAGAPVLGNKEQWAPRIAKGMDALLDTALNGSKVNPAMLPKGGFAELSDAEVKSIVDYMVNSSK